MLKSFKTSVANMAKRRSEDRSEERPETRGKLACVGNVTKHLSLAANAPEGVASFHA